MATARDNIPIRRLLSSEQLQFIRRILAGPVHDKSDALKSQASAHLVVLLALQDENGLTLDHYNRQLTADTQRRLDTDPVFRARVDEQHGAEMDVTRAAMEKVLESEGAGQLGERAEMHLRQGTARKMNLMDLMDQHLPAACKRVEYVQSITGTCAGLLLT